MDILSVIRSSVNQMWSRVMVITLVLGIILGLYTLYRVRRLLRHARNTKGS